MACQVKICGVTSVADAVAAVELGATAVGLNFYERSPRCIDEIMAREIVNALAGRADIYVLAVDEPWHESIARARRLESSSCVQVHRGKQTLCPDPERSWMPAFPVKDAESLRTIEEFLQRCREAGRMPTAVLVDAHVPGSFGGTGQVVPWELLASWNPGVNVVLAGGLKPENVAQAIRTVGPHMVDVASGVESSPGKKDVDKMQRFIDAVRSV